ncbi:MAG: sensor histidine kinase [Sphingobacteriaceae bacterium]|nr:MAG: sensor histidine kinase [Sphingobacteriaceae bacterium]
MFKTYQIKWYVIVSSILWISGLLLRPGSLKAVDVLELMDYTVRLFSTLFVCWFIHGYLLLHKFSFETSYGKLFFSNILAITATLILTYLYFWILPENSLIDQVSNGVHLTNFIHNFTRAFFISIICYVVFYSIHTSSALQNSKLENELLAQAHLQAQLLSLQQQISPHFLFNSLSTLKTIASDQPTKNYIVQLASVYRYVLNFNERYLTPLKDELTFIRSYLYIMNQRFEESLQISIDIPDEYLHFQIPPLSLQLLVENAIKHNIISLDNPLHISIFTDNSPALIVKNNFQLKKVSEEGTGMGLNNIRERYKLLIHKPIKIVNDQSTFSVTLPLLKI